MKKFVSILLAVAMLTAVMPVLAASPVRVVVDAAELSPFGAFEGWGTSLCWWAETLGGEEEAYRKELSKAFFDLDEGLGLNIVRYNIGAGDDPTHDHLNNGNDMRGLPVWVDEDGVFNPDADPNQIAILQDAVSYGADIVECFSNSPPYYMTESGCSSGNHDKNENNISVKNFARFAEYLATVTKYIQNELGIDVDTVSPMNEPDTDYWGYEGTQEGCHIDDTDHSALIVAVRKALNEKGLFDVAVAAADENNSDKMADYIVNYTGEALSYIPRFNVHSYSGSGTKIRKAVESLGKKLYMTEDDWAASIGHDAGSMGPAMWLSKKIVSDMNAMKPNAWVCWQITGPAPGGNSDSGYWYMSDYDLETHTLTKFKKYYAFAHYTKFIRPGDYILNTESDDVLAARSFETGKTVLVITNADERDKNYEIDLSSLDKLGTQITAYRTDNERDLEQMDEICALDGKILKTTIPVNTITTIVIENETPAEVKSMGLTLDGDAQSCFVGESVSFTASGEGKIVYSAEGGTITDDGIFTASEEGVATVTARIDGTDMSASKTVDVVSNTEVVRIVNSDSNLALQETDDGYAQYGDNDSAYQYWRMDKIDDIAAFTNLRSGEVLEDNGGKEWKVERQDGGYSLTNTLTGKALDVYGHSHNEGGTVGTYEFGGGANQIWNFSFGNLEATVDSLTEETAVEKLVPLEIDGTAAYGGSEEVSFDKVFDGDITTHHDAWDGENSYVSATLPQNKPVTLIRYYPREGFDWRMYGGRFCGVKDGEETLLYTVPDKLKNDWNEIRLENEVMYDKIVYHTPSGGLCNVAEIEFYNMPFDASLNYSDGLDVQIKSYSDDEALNLAVIYRNKGKMSAVDVNTLFVEKYSLLNYSTELNCDYESADVYLTRRDGSIVAGGYVYLGKE